MKRVTNPVVDSLQDVAEPAKRIEDLGPGRPFVFHCHNVEHEDMRMMGVCDPTPGPGNTEAFDKAAPLDGEREIDSDVSGVVPSCLDLEHDHDLYFDVAGDLDRLAGRGVGFLECDYDMLLRGNRGRVK